MAVNENITWRKFPISLIRDEELDYVSSLMGDLAPLPLLLMTVAYGKCDDDGVFDVDDGVIFSRLMRMGAPEDVLKCADLLAQRKLLTRVLDDPESSVYMITDWDCGQRVGGRKALTAEERRRAIASKIYADRPQVRQTRPNDNDFLCPENDKNAKSVATQPFFCQCSDKIQKNVATIDRQTDRRETERQTEPDRQRQRDIETDKTDTHTEAGRAEFLEYSFRPARIDETPEEKERIRERRETSVQRENNQSLAAQAMQDTSEVDTPKKQSPNLKEWQRVYGVFNSFFAKNCLGYNQEQYYQDERELADRMILLADDKNQPEIIASVFLSQFKILADTEGYYWGIELTPANLLKPGVYTHVCALAAKILMTQGTKSSEWTKQMDLERQQCEADREAVDVEISEQCVKYGIDVNDPERVQKIIMARGRNTPEGNSS